MVRRSLVLVAVAALLSGCAPAVEPPREPGAVPTSTPSSVVLEPAETDGGTLYAPAGLSADERQEWLRRLGWAAATVRETDLGSLTEAWDGRIAVELPAGQADYLALAGPGSEQAAASTRCDADGSRIAINPVIRGEPSSYLDALLLHETVHAATDSGCAEAPLWIEEGLAEWLTEQHDPGARHTNQLWLDRELAAGLPSALPADDAFRGSASEISGAYALAAFAVTTAVGNLGHDQAMAFFADPDARTTTQVAQLYLAALRARGVPTVSELR